MKYNKIDVTTAKLQIGIDQHGNTFMRFQDFTDSGLHKTDIILGNEHALLGLKYAIEGYLEETIPENEEIH